MQALDATTLRLAAENIVREVGSPPSGNVLLICSREKLPIGEAAAGVFEDQGLEQHILLLGARQRLSLERLRKTVEEVAEDWGLVVLLHPHHAPFLFEVIGRPDQGVRIPEKHLFCDWLIGFDSLVRTYGVDWEALTEFRQNLLLRLSGAKQVRVCTEKGTDLVLYPRGWQNQDAMGEVFTAPLEAQTSGVIYVDGCAYGGPPEKPFWLKVEAGRVVNLDTLDISDEQQKWVRTDMTRDEHANVLAEFGIGINPGARWDADLMEAEQARGTCHFGFGNNLMYGGANGSGYHFDLVVREPTIVVDGKVICEGGKFE